jgi:WhiB family transcriptional regulator, redox-sensing transcriptional regulator
LTGRHTTGREHTTAGASSAGVTFAAEAPPAADLPFGSSLALARLGEGLAEFDPELGWDEQARCRSHDPTLFFGPNRFEPKRERLAREAEAKAICSTCPCLAACREYALSAGELYGVWGGLGETDRRDLLADRGSIATAV